MYLTRIKSNELRIKVDDRGIYPVDYTTGCKETLIHNSGFIILSPEVIRAYN